jgi:hypothetical protein
MQGSGASMGSCISYHYVKEEGSFPQGSGNFLGSVSAATMLSGRAAS